MTDNTILEAVAGAITSLFQWASGPLIGVVQNYAADRCEEAVESVMLQAIRDWVFSSLGA